MDRFPVFKEYDPKIAPFLRDECPALDATVALNLFRQRMTDSELYPCVADANPITAKASVLKVISGLQSTMVEAGKSRRRVEQ